MKKILFVLCLYSSKIMALDAVVTVLKTPMFKYRSHQAPVVQYLRKGDVIKIHPSIANDSQFDQYAPSPDKLTELKKSMRDSTDYNQDKLFRGEEENTAFLEDELIPTLDRQGNIVYVLSDHIFVYFNDAREYKQNVLSKDPTDYRLHEPLPKKYPLRSVTGLRGQFIIGMTQAYFESYPYRDQIKRKGYQSPLDMLLTFLKQAPGNYQEKLFLGLTLNFRTSSNTYAFQDRRLSEEISYRFGLGPTIAYDAFKSDKNRLNLSGTVLVNIFDRKYITQTLDQTSENRLYAGYSLSPRISLQYHRKQVLEDVDFVIGTALEMTSATNYQAKNGAGQASWWKQLGNDSFTTRTTFALGVYVGLQSAY
jgi:hypothetical protein